MKKQDYKALRAQMATLTPDQAGKLALKFVEENVSKLDAEFIEGLINQPPPREQYILNYANRGCGAAQLVLGTRMISKATEAATVSEGIFWLARASAAGNGQANHILGSLYASGSLLEHNLTKAKQHLEQAAELNLPKSQYLLGILHLDESTEYYAPLKAKSWLKKSADQGHARAIELLEEL